VSELRRPEQTSDAHIDQASAPEPPQPPADAIDGEPALGRPQAPTPHDRDTQRPEIIDGEPRIGPPQPAPTEGETGDPPALIDGEPPIGPAGGPDTPDGQPDTRPPGYRTGDLQPTGRIDATYGVELMLGEDERQHCAGDPIGSQRTDTGKLKGPDGKWTADAHPRPTDELQHRAEQDLESLRRHEPERGAGKPDDDVIDARNEREDLVDQRDRIWEDLEPISAKLSDHDIKLDKSTTRNDDRNIAADADPYLSAAESQTLADKVADLVELNQQIKKASENLGTAGGALTALREFPTATLISGGDGLPGTSGNFDRVIMVDDATKSVIIMEEKGVGSGLGSRLVATSDVSGQPHTRAEQGSTEYLRHVLQHDNKLAKALDANPNLAQRIEQILRTPGSGNIRYLLVRTAKEGIVTVTDFKINSSALRPQTLRLPGNGR